MSVRAFIATALLTAASLLTVPAIAQEPSLHDVYQAAESGNLSQAQRMMGEVLRAHPNSAKAHYVEAELLAKQGRLSAAATELNTAERLEPGLPFARPAAVRELRARIASGQSLQSGMPAPALVGSGGIPWGLLLLMAGGVALLVVGVRALGRRNVVSTTGASAYGPNAAVPPGTATPSGIAASGGGMGSGILGGLATGAALGAGMVAGEALAHRFMGGQQGENVAPSVGGYVESSLPNDMGGTDFGVADSSSWDDGLGGLGGGGGSDWS